MSRYQSLIVLLVLFTNTTFAGKIVANVIKARGNVTMLRPGKVEAELVQAGQELEEDTSIVTNKRSFVSVLFNDKSRMNLGPNGKVVIKQADQKSKANIIGLLNGKVRASVKRLNNKAKKNKLYIRTRTAAMGVRGTDFQTIYNSENQNTTLLTFKGEVAMVKLDENKLANDVSKPNSNTISSEKEVVESELLEKALSKKEKVNVLPGQFSGVVKKLNVTSKPVKINPVQLTVLYNNDEFGTNKNKAISKISPKDLLKQAPQEAPLEGIYDPEKNKYAPKAGGYIDMKTGLYIPPEKDSEFDLKKNIFEPKAIGNVDLATGEYIPPKGLKLDAKKGFIPEGENIKDSKLIAMTSELNKVIAQDVVLGNEANKQVTEKEVRLTSKETFIKDFIDFSFSTYQETLEYDNQSDGTFTSFTSESASFFSVDWFLSSGTSFQPFIAMTLKNVDYNARERFQAEQGSTKLLGIGFGSRFFLTPRWNFHFKISTDQEIFYNINSSFDTFDRVALVKGIGIIKGNFWQSNRWMFNVSSSFTINMSEDKGDFRVKTGFGIGFRPSIRYDFNKFFNTALSMFYNYDKATLEASNFTSSVSREKSGMDIALSYIF